MADEQGFTPGPLKVVMNGTLTGVWAEVRQECTDPETGEAWERELGQTETVYVRRADAYPFDPFEDAPEQYEFTEDGEEMIANARLWAAAPELYAAAKLAAPHGDRLQHGPNVSISAEAYRALCAALAKARGQ